MKRSVVLAGATGLVGSRVLELLQSDLTVDKIYVLSRKEPDHLPSKAELIRTDFTRLQDLAARILHAETLFCCIGTTMRKAGSKEAFRAVDYEIPLQLAALASEAGIKKFLVISSLGADPESKNFYLQTKGEMERDIDARFRFKKLAFLIAGSQGRVPARGADRPVFYGSIFLPSKG